MVKIDTTVWSNIERLRNTCVNNAKTLASFTALNVFLLWYYQAWIGVGINILGFITAMLTIISHSKFKKLPP